MEMTQELCERAVALARENHVEHNMSCSESVFNALIRAGVIDVPEDYTRIGTALSGGVCASGNTCGAIYGGLMAIGVAYGRRTPRQDEDKLDPEMRAGIEKDWRFAKMKRFNLFVNEMEERIGTVCCWDVIKGSGGYFEGKRLMKCPEIITTATEVACKYIGMSDEECKELPFGKNILGF